MLRCAPSIASDTQLGADGHVPIFGGRSGVIQTWLYGNNVLIGLPIHLLRRLQSVQNAAARLICRLRRLDHVTDVLVSCASQSASSTRSPCELSRFCMGPHRSVSDLLFPDLLFVSPICLVDSLFALLALTVWWCYRLNCQLELSLWPVLASEIVCQRHRRCRPSAND